MKIAILGTRGIPNRYGGFEQFAEYLSAGLVKKAHEVYVYNSHNHFYRESTWNNVHIIHCYDPEYMMGSAGQFFYDLNCILDARKRNFDVILMLGYTSSSVWGHLYPKKSTIVSNMDGMEWKRSKYSPLVQKFLFFAEKLAMQFSDFIIADSLAIQSYLEKKYSQTITYIPYGAQVFTYENDAALNSYNLCKYGYFMTMGRMVRENNMEMILDGFTASNSDKKFVVISNHSNKLGRYLVNKYKNDPRIIFTGAIFDPKVYHTLKLYAQLYFHGHSVGGTNPCLLEAMASRALIAAHHNVFHEAILNQDAYYFSTAADVQLLVENTARGCRETAMIGNNYKKIQEQLNWDRIIQQYESFMMQCHLSAQ